MFISGRLTTGRVGDAGEVRYHRFLLARLHALGYTDVSSWGFEGTCPITGLLA
jgi:hypothetical protein